MARNGRAHELAASITLEQQIAQAQADLAAAQERLRALQQEAPNRPRGERKDPKDRGLLERPPGSGIWWVDYYDQNRKRHREKVGTKTSARAILAQRKTEIRQQKFDPDMVARRKAKLLLADAVKEYLKEARSVKRSWQDDERYGAMWVSVFPDVALLDIKPADIDIWKQQRMAQAAPGKRRNIAPATVNRSLAFLKHLFNRAIRDGHAVTNPVARVKMLRENNTRTRFLLDDEEAELRRDMVPEEFAIVEVAFKTGLREAEQFTLQRTQVDLRNRLITIPRSKHGELRHIDIGDDVAEILRRFLKQASNGGSDYVFPAALLSPDTGTKGDPQDVQERAGQNWVRRCFNKAVQRAGIKDLVWHSLRHTFGSRLVMAGVDLPTVQALMGHKTIAMTMRYAHLAPGHKKDAVQRLNRPKQTELVTSMDTHGDNL